CQNVRLEFRNLIDKEHTVMRQGNLAWGGAYIPAQQTRVAHRMMRGAERALSDERLAGPEQPDNTVNFGGLQRFVEGERRQDRCEPFCEHGFSRAGGADQQHIMVDITYMCMLLWKNG